MPCMERAADEHRPRPPSHPPLRRRFCWLAHLQKPPILVWLMMARPGVLHVSFVFALAACAGANHPATLPVTPPQPRRVRVAQQLIERCDRAIAEDSYDSVVQCMAKLANLYTPAEYAEAVFPRSLERAAQYLVRKGSPRGDEGRVLSGLLIESLLHPDDAAALERYERLVYWSFDARADMNGPLERFQGLMEAWEEHARLSPTPAVIDALERLRLEQRAAVVQLFLPHEKHVPPASAAAF